MKTKEKIEKAEELLAELKAELLKEEKPEFQVGDWVTDTESLDHSLVRITKIKNGRVDYYGFRDIANDPEWVEDWLSEAYLNEDCRHAHRS